MKRNEWIIPLTTHKEAYKNATSETKDKVQDKPDVYGWYSMRYCDMFNLMRTVGKDGWFLFMYLFSQKEESNYHVSSSEVMNAVGFTEREYKTAKEHLKAAGIIIVDDDNNVVAFNVPEPMTEEEIEKNILQTADKRKAGKEAKRIKEEEYQNKIKQKPIEDTEAYDDVPYKEEEQKQVETPPATTFNDAALEDVCFTENDYAATGTDGKLSPYDEHYWDSPV